MTNFPKKDVCGISEEIWGRFSKGMLGDFFRGISEGNSEINFKRISNAAFWKFSKVITKEASE